MLKNRLEPDGFKGEQLAEKNKSFYNNRRTIWKNFYENPSSKKFTL